MKRKYGQRLGLIFLAVLFTMQATEFEAWARAGGGGGFGSRGSRSFSSPSRSYSSPSRSYSNPNRNSSNQFSAPAPPRAPLASPAPSLFGGSGFMRSMAGGLAGGFLGGMLFRSLGFAGSGGMGGGMGGGGMDGGMNGGMNGGMGGGGGVGLMDLVILGGIAFAIYWVVKRRKLVAASAEGLFQRTSASQADTAWNGQDSRQIASAPQALMIQDADMEQGLESIRYNDPNFNEGRFREATTDLFFKVQAAWGNRDLSPVSTILTPQMLSQLTEDVERLKAQRRINRLENIAVRSVEITEAWQEKGQDYITVRFLASLLDYTVEEGTLKILEGIQTIPTKFEEFWTVTRPTGSNPFILSAINQAEN